MPTPSHALRADAERNRQAIICAAGRVFANEGTGVTLEHIAGEAGVGVGTIYRRFATIDDLVAVVLEAKMTDYADRTEHEAERALNQPWEAFRDYVLFILEHQADDIAFSDVILAHRGGTALFRQQMKRALQASVQLVDRARRAGAIRPDFDHSDLYMLMQANAGLVKGTQRSAPESWKRFGDYMLQSFRKAGPVSELTPPSALLTRTQAAR